MTSASGLITQNELFEEAKIPVDVYWFDIGYTTNSMYFAFDQTRYSKKGLEVMNQIIDFSDRKLVVITDPHVKLDEAYRVYRLGKDLDYRPDPDDPSMLFTNIFIKSKNLPGTPFEGSSWPGNSVWIDFMNEGA